MNAKQTEEITGISRRNLRFYEQEGLISPKRNPINDYREYSQKDIESLKLIRALRMLDVPLEDILLCLNQKMTIAEISKVQEERLKKRQKELETAILFCRQLQKTPALDAVEIDNLLSRMDQPEMKDKLFNNWKKDYKEIVKAEEKKVFSFTTDETITTPEEFTIALCKYGDENHLNLVITKEGLTPEFEIDGIAYRAQRIYRRVGPVPVMIVQCTALHPEEIKANVTGIKGIIMKIFHKIWPLILFLVIWMPRVIQAKGGKQWEVLLAGGMLGVTIWMMYGIFRNFKS